MAAHADTALFDLGNVLIAWDPRNLYAKLFPGRPREMAWFLRNVVNGAWIVRHDRGLSFDEAIAELAARHPGYAAEIAAFGERWPETLGGEIAGSVALLDRLHAGGVPLYALTNWSAETFPYAEANFPLLKRFRGITVSGRVGLVKPEPAIFEHAIRSHGLEPARTLFVDDSARNTEAAAALGFHVHTFREPGELEACLVAHGLL